MGWHRAAGTAALAEATAAAKATVPLAEAATLAEAAIDSGGANKGAADGRDEVIGCGGGRSF